MPHQAPYFYVPDAEDLKNSAATFWITLSAIYQFNTGIPTEAH